MFLFDDVFSFVKIPEELISQYAAAGRWEIYRSITVDINIDSQLKFSYMQVIMEFFSLYFFQRFVRMSVWLLFQLFCIELFPFSRFFSIRLQYFLALSLNKYHWVYFESDCVSYIHTNIFCTVPVRNFFRGSLTLL